MKVGQMTLEQAKAVLSTSWILSQATKARLRYKLVELHHRPGSLCCAMVRTGSEELNHLELMRNYPMILVRSGAQWFEEVL